MNPIVELFIRIPPILLLAYIPFVCYLDLKYREVEHGYWIPLYLVGALVMGYLYLSGTYPWTLLILSLIMCAFDYGAMRLGVFEGGDLLFLCGINLFFIMNTIPIPKGIGLIPFYIYLVAALLFTVPVVLVLNLWAGRRGLRYPRGIPMMLPISAALIMTVVR